jgi:HlyD family secretion protein
MNRTYIALACLLLAGCDDSATRLNGYAEGKFVMLAPESAGRVTTMKVGEGARVEAGTVLFEIESEAERSALSAARAGAEAAMARFEDAAAGGRTQEVEAARAQLTQARANQERVRRDEQRAQDLFKSGTIARARLDDAIAAATAADAQIAELRQRLTLVELPARENQLKALAAAAREAEAQVKVADEALRRRTVIAPMAGRIERVIRRPGDLAGPSLPAVRFLPDGQVLAVLFVPEPRLVQTQVGTKLRIVCDGCPDNARAEITSIANEAEFTPPVIFSDNERAKLVFRAEARLAGFVPPPGLPLSAVPVE